METTSAVFSTCTSQRKRLKTCRFDLFLCEVQVENTANFHEGRGRRTGNDPLSSHEMTLSGKYLWFYTFQAPIPDGFRENQLGKSAELVFQAPIPGSLRAMRCHCTKQHFVYPRLQISTFPRHTGNRTQIVKEKRRVFEE